MKIIRSAVVFLLLVMVLSAAPIWAQDLEEPEELPPFLEEEGYDIAVASVAIFPAPPLPVNQTATIEVIVSNPGMLPAHNVSVWVEVDALTLGPTLIPEPEGVPADPPVTVQFPWTPTAAGSYDVYVGVSTEFQSPEGYPVSDMNPSDNEFWLYGVEVEEVNQPPVADANGPYDATTEGVLVDIDPDTLNINSRGKWITAYLVEDPAALVDITLDGSGSYDPDGDPITYAWIIEDLDGNIVATLFGEAPVVALGVGLYYVTLVVNDATVDSEPATTTITVYLLDVSTVDPTSVYLNGVQGERGDFQDPELMVKFARALIANDIEVGNFYEEVEMDISGAVSGSAIIRVIDKGKN